MVRDLGEERRGEERRVKGEVRKGGLGWSGYTMVFMLLPLF